MKQYRDTITLSQRAADGISLALDQEFNKNELPERMAWVVMLLRRLEDEADFFPMGKWATIQSIEEQLNVAVDNEMGER